MHQIAQQLFIIKQKQYEVQRETKKYTGNRRLSLRPSKIDLRFGALSVEPRGPGLAVIAQDGD